MKWRQANYGKDHEKVLFENLQEKVDHYNATKNMAKGKAICSGIKLHAEKEHTDELYSNNHPQKHKRTL